MLYYLPLEPYVERYTGLMSCKDGWAETWFKKYGVEFTRIDGKSSSGEINCGWVLDAVGRCRFAMSQIDVLLEKINAGEVKDGDVVYAEDFWHPGMESLFYVRHLTGIKFKIGTFCHAQSVDDTDFTYPMKNWMRPIEVGFGRQYDFIFTCSQILRQLLIQSGVGSEDNVFISGLPLNSELLKKQVQEKMNVKLDVQKEPFVLFSSRFDDEKDPMFFLDLVEACPDIQFKLVKPRKLLSHNPAVVERTDKIVNRPGSNLELVDTSNKANYYNTLARAKVQFNCAHQDWVSWTILEGLVFGCLPLYPIWKDFPYELRGDPRYLYEKRNLNAAVEHLRILMNTTSEQAAQMNKDLQYVVTKHDNTWKTQLKTMNLIQL